MTELNNITKFLLKYKYIAIVFATGIFLLALPLGDDRGLGGPQLPIPGLLPLHPAHDAHDRASARGPLPQGHTVLRRRDGCAAGLGRQRRGQGGGGERNRTDHVTNHTAPPVVSPAHPSRPAYFERSEPLWRALKE